MADEEAEQESGSPGGDLLELRRLRERLLELETGLRESAEPAVQAATEYCKQLCQELEHDPLPRVIVRIKTSTDFEGLVRCFINHLQL